MSSSDRPRVAIGGILHESNTFSSTPTQYSDFERGTLTRGEAILGEWAESKHEVGGFIEGARHSDLEICPTLVAQATPSGTVTDAAFGQLTAELLDLIKSAGRLDGLLLALHGAMVTESHAHADLLLLM
jgi:microcystin degradation protein MlrC